MKQIQCWKFSFHLSLWNCIPFSNRFNLQRCYAMWFLVQIFEIDTDSKICTSTGKAIHKILQVWWIMLCVSTATLSANSVYRTRAFYFFKFTCVFAFKQDGLDSFLSVYVTMYLLPMCQKDVYEAAKRKLQKLLLLARSIVWHHCEF